MNKKYILRKNEEIQNVVNNSSKKVNNYYVIYNKVNNLNHNRYCISVSKKIGKANIRNLFKRRIKDILMKNNIVGSFDYVIILRKAILDVSYNKMSDELINLMEVKWKK